ncbi:hypothetical protein H2248_006077 [Termitomyces sp. 'cryptogamus']|nr:hypothetical protein H2248_006077 [Termitomyces sp. 'cryptogamus']
MLLMISRFNDFQVVGTLWVLDTLATIFVAHSLYTYLVLDYGLPPQVYLNIPWSFATENMLVASTSPFVISRIENFVDLDHFPCSNFLQSYYLESEHSQSRPCRNYCARSDYASPWIR